MEGTEQLELNEVLHTEEENKQEKVIEEVVLTEQAKLDTNKKETTKNITIDYLAKNIANKTIRTNIDFMGVIEGHWALKKGVKQKDIRKACTSSQNENKEIDMKILRKNLRSILQKA